MSTQTSRRRNASYRTVQPLEALQARLFEFLECFLQRRDTGVFDEGSEIGFDGALLVDLWDQMYMRKDIRRAWQPLIDEARGG